jgi:hypothetical protein
MPPGSARYPTFSRAVRKAEHRLVVRDHGLCIDPGGMTAVERDDFDGLLVMGGLIQGRGGRRS